MLPDAVVPAALLPPTCGHTDRGTTATSETQHILRGLCLLVLGDSTTSETVHDLALMLLDVKGNAHWDYMHRATRMPRSADVKVNLANEHSWLPTRQIFVLSAHGGNVTFAPSHRRMWFKAAASDTVVAHRFIGHADLDDNYMGVATVNQETVRREITGMAEDLCEHRPRVLWFQSGYHELVQARTLRCTAQRPCNLVLTEELRMRYEQALEWLESLTPHRVWLSRHSTSVDNVSSLEEWARSLLPRRLWLYSDHREAWACFANERNVSLHTGAIQLGFINRHYCCAFLSSLRTWLAIQLTRRSVGGVLYCGLRHEKRMAM